MDQHIPIQQQAAIRPGAVTRILKRAWQFKALYLMLLPGVVYYIWFKYIPMYGVVIAF